MANTGFILFRNVTIPYNSRITKAVVEFTGYAPADGIDTNVLCYFEDADNPSAPSDKADLDGRSLTSAVSWEDIQEWRDNYVYQSPELSTILQTIISRGNWVSGNNVLFTAIDDSSSSYRLWSAIEHRGGLEKACLRVSWIVPEKLDLPIIMPVETFQLGDFDCSIRVYPTDASVYYTTDGSDPDETDTLYSVPFTISESQEIRARAYKQYWTYSDVASRDYTYYDAYAYFSFSNADDGWIRNAIRQPPTLPPAHDLWTIWYSSRLMFGSFWNYVIHEQWNNEGWCRFRIPNIPQGASIAEAYVTFYGDPDWDGAWSGIPFQMVIEGEDADTGAYPLSVSAFQAIVTTTASAVWTIDPDDIVSNGPTTTPNIASIIQEIVNRPGWTPGNSVLLKFTLNYVPDYPETRFATFLDYEDGNPDYKPRLDIVVV